MSGSGTIWKCVPAESVKLHVTVPMAETVQVNPLPVPPMLDAAAERTSPTV